jgi:nickel transport protein
MNIRITIGRWENWTVVLAFALLLLIAQFPGIAHAHKVNIFAWVEGDMIYTESKFSGGRRAKQAPVEVYDENGKILLKGVTNDQGEFSFKIPKRTSLRIVLLAGMGHRAEWTIPADEIQEVFEKASEENIMPQSEKSRPIDTAKANASGSIDVPELQTAFEKALDKKLRPIIKMISAIKDEKTSPQEIFRGIGYIIGLIGLTLYFKSRR